MGSSPSLKDLLAEDGFKGRKSLTRARTSLQSKSPTVHKKDLFLNPREVTTPTQRTRSDVSRYDTQQRDGLVIRRREKSKIPYSWSNEQEEEEENEIVQENERVKECVSERDTRRNIREMSRPSSNVTRSFGKGANISKTALDEAAIQATVSILSSYMTRFLKDRELRQDLRRDSLETQWDGDDEEIETAVTTELEEAIDAIETWLEEGEEYSISPRELKKYVSKLIAVSGISDHKLSSVAHLYLGIVYKLRGKDRSVAKHILQVFIDSPFIARTRLLPGLWDCLFLPNLSHLKIWYENELAALRNEPERLRKIETLERVYMEILDSGTLQFAGYYRDWLTGGGGSEPVVPSIRVPSVRATQPMMVSEKFYKAVFRDSDKSFTSVEENDQQGTFDENSGSFVEQKVLTTEKDHNESFESLSFQEKQNSFRSLSESPSGMKPPDTELAKVKPTSAELVETTVACSTSIPRDFICPLTGKIFEEPVTLETGETFERSAIKALLDQQARATCPVTSRPLQFKQVPSTNSVLKRLIETWKSRHRFTRSFLSLRGLEFLLQRFKTNNNLEDATLIASLLVDCIEADPSCRNQVAKQINRIYLVELIHSEQAEARQSALLLLVELICLQRKKDVIELLSELKSEEKGIEGTMQVILVHLHNCSLHQKPLIAVLLLYFDLMVEPKKYSIYREEAVDAITEALDDSLRIGEIGENCRRAILILGGRFSSAGENLTEAWILHRAGFKAKDQNYSLVNNFSMLEDEEEHINDEWHKNLCVSLLDNGKKSFLKAISKCLCSKNSDMVSTCLTTVAWLSMALALTPGTELQLPAFAVLSSRLKECLVNSQEIEHKVLASASLLNFSQISECRILLKSMEKNIASSLRRLSEITWTAKKLYTIIVHGEEEEEES